jgi:hypothetical protein
LKEDIEQATVGMARAVGLVHAMQKTLKDSDREVFEGLRAQVSNRLKELMRKR